MPTTTVGLYEIILEQEYFNQEIFNVFHYLSNTSDDDVQELAATAFDEDLMALFAAVQNTSLLYTNIRAKNLTGNLADFNLTPSVAAGGVAGAVTADFVAAGLRYNRETKDTRNGAKRISGLVEENIQGGTFTGPFNVLLDNLVAGLSADISTVGGVFTPVILRKPVGPGAVWTYNTITGVQNLNRVTTQNSRKKF